MNTAQQVIKACALAFAVLLIVGIFSALIGAGIMMSYVFGERSDVAVPETAETVLVDEVQTVRDLQVQVKASRLRIERGETFEVRANEKIIDLKQDGDKLYVVEKDFHFWEHWDERNSELVIIVPQKLRRLQLEVGAGSAVIDGLEVENAELDLGAGRTELNRLKVTQRAEIEGGVGLVVLREAELANLDLDMGVGKVEFEGILTGSNTVDAGVGKLEMRLAGDTKDYRIRSETGIGAITVDGEKMQDEQVWGDGTATIDIHGGVGAIEIRMLK